MIFSICLISFIHLSKQKGYSKTISFKDIGITTLKCEKAKFHAFSFNK